MRRAKSRSDDAPAGRGSELEAVALRLLARREHSREELRAKLAARSFPAEEIDELLARLAEQRLQSDERYAEAYSRQRVTAGYGPLRIRAELRQRGVDEVVTDRCLEPFEARWPELLDAQRQRRFGEAPPADRADWLRQARHLEQRGFATGLIRQRLSAVEHGWSEH